MGTLKPPNLLPVMAFRFLLPKRPRSYVNLIMFYLRVVAALPRAEFLRPLAVSTARYRTTAPARLRGIAIAMITFLCL